MHVDVTSIREDPFIRRDEKRKNNVRGSWRSARFKDVRRTLMAVYESAPVRAIECFLFLSKIK